MSDHKHPWRWDETIAAFPRLGEVEIPISCRWRWWRRKEAVVLLDMQDARVLRDMLSSALGEGDD